jgi:hypothetical protein
MNHRSTSGASEREHQEMQSLRAPEDQTDDAHKVESTNDKKMFVMKCEPAVFVLLFGVLFTILCVGLLGSMGGGDVKQTFEHKVKQTNSTSSSASATDSSPPSPPPPLPPPLPPAHPSPPPTLEGEAEEIASLKEQLVSSTAMRAEAEAKSVALGEENERLAASLAAKEEEMGSLKSDLMRAVDGVFGGGAEVPPPGSPGSPESPSPAAVPAEGERGDGGGAGDGGDGVGAGAGDEVKGDTATAASSG